MSADGPAGGGKQDATVSGAGLTWALVKRANGQSGDAEVWEATAAAVLSSATVTSTESASGFGQDLTVIAIEGVKGIGGTAAGSAATGAPSVSLTSTGDTSLVFAVGHDWDNAIARTLPSGWVLLDQWLNNGSGDTFWSQYTNTPTGAAGSVVAVNDTAPTKDQWNLVAVELLNDDSWPRPGFRHTAGRRELVVAHETATTKDRVLVSQPGCATETRDSVLVYAVT